MSDMAKTTTMQHSLPDAILEDIFLRLDAAADVVRASAVCKSHRRVVCDRRFLRRYRFLYPPPVLGFLQSMGTGEPKGLLHAELPHQSAPAASTLAQAADFTFSFLPMDDHHASSWGACDASDGRVLLSRRSTDGSSTTFMDLMICDPLYYRYVQIPPIPEDLVPEKYSAEIMESEPFLLPSREEEKETQFQVIYNRMSKFNIITFLFNSDTRKWCLATSFSFLPDRPVDDLKNLVRHYVGGRFYWVHQHVLNHMLVLDPVEIQFSIVRLPFHASMRGRVQGVAVVDAGLNRLGLIVLDVARNFNLYSKAWQDNGEISEEWRHDKHNPLLERYIIYKIIGAAEGSLLLVGSATYMPSHYAYFILNPKTLLVEKLCESVHALFHALQYARYPPSLSPPSI